MQHKRNLIAFVRVKLASAVTEAGGGLLTLCLH